MTSTKLLPVDDARAAMLAAVAALPAESVAIAKANGRVLAEDVAAVRDQPPFAASAMDGWAVRGADTPGTLRIVGDLALFQAIGSLLLEWDALDHEFIERHTHGFEA